MSYEEAIFQMYLGEVPMFQACSEEELSAIAYLASPRALEAGSEIVREGDTGDDFYVLMMGTATVSRRGQDVGNLEPGDFFGELALFDPAPRNATITADVPVTMAVMERSRFQAALDAIPAVRDALFKGMARRLHEVDARVDAPAYPVGEAVVRLQQRPSGEGTERQRTNRIEERQTQVGYLMTAHFERTHGRVVMRSARSSY